MQPVENFPENFTKISNRVFCGGQPRCYDHLSAIASLHDKVVGVVNIKSGQHIFYHYNKFREDILKYGLFSEVEVHSRECTFHTRYSKFEEEKKTLYKLIYDMKMMLCRYPVLYIHRVTGKDIDLILSTSLACIVDKINIRNTLLYSQYRENTALCSQIVDLFKGKLFDMLSISQDNLFNPKNSLWVSQAYGGENLHVWAQKEENKNKKIKLQEEEEECKGKERKNQLKKKLKLCDSVESQLELDEE